MAPLPKNSNPYPELVGIEPEQFPGLLVEAKNELVKAVQEIARLHEQAEYAERSRISTDEKSARLVHRWLKLRKIMREGLTGTSQTLDLEIAQNRWGLAQQSALSMAIHAGYMGLMDQLETEERE
jgi:hypothetical protein